MLVHELLTTTNATVLYDNGNGNLKMSAIVVNNQTDTAATISFFVVPDGGTAGVTNNIFAYETSVGANDQIMFEFNNDWAVDKHNTSLVAQAGTGNALMVTMNGSR